MQIVVVGGGIAGLTSALALASRGHQITVFERRTGFGEPGAGIQLSPNATRVLVGLGFGGSLQRLGSEPDRVVVRDLRTGREIGAVALGRHVRERFGAPYLSIARADLHTALLDAVRSQPNIRLRVGRSANALQQDPDSARVTFETTGGVRETMAGDLVVAADGLWSTLRGALGDARTPRSCGYAAFRAVVPAGLVPSGLAHDVGLWLGRGRHVVHYPVAAGRLVNIVAVVRRKAPLEGWSNDEARESVLGGLSGAADAVREVAALPESWAGWSLFDLPARRLALGRVALIGDAAHPVLPYLAQGGSLAIEDAAVLAARLPRDGAGVRQALREYGRDRLPRVRKVQAAARRNGRVYHAGPVVAAARNVVMNRLGPGGMTDRYGWLYGWAAPGP